MPTPGLMLVTSRVIDPSKTSDEKFNRFYNKEHLPDVLARAKAKGDITRVALRYKNVNAEASVPYLALYPVSDASIMISPEQGKVVEDTRKSQTFDGGDIYDYIDFGLRPYTPVSYTHLTLPTKRIV